MNKFFIVWTSKYFYFINFIFFLFIFFFCFHFCVFSCKQIRHVIYQNEHHHQHHHQQHQKHQHSTNTPVTAAAAAALWAMAMLGRITPLVGSILVRLIFIFPWILVQLSFACLHVFDLYNSRPLKWLSACMCWIYTPTTTPATHPFGCLKAKVLVFIFLFHCIVFFIL